MNEFFPPRVLKETKLFLLSFVAFFVSRNTQVYTYTHRRLIDETFILQRPSYDRVWEMQTFRVILHTIQ